MRATAMAVAMLAGALSAPARAHLVETGFGAFYDGLAHVVVTPADAFVVVALALLAGQRGTRAARLAVFALPIAWLVGGVAGALWPALAPTPLATTLSFAVTGALVALDADLRDAGIVAIAVAAGALHGIVNGAAMGSTGASVVALAGAITAVSCVAAIVAAEVTALPAGWPRMAVRVGGSWIAAAGLLMLGWIARGAL